MARTPIQTLELNLPRDYAAIAMAAQLAPWPKRLRANAWRFDRQPFSHDTPVAAGGRLGKIYLGEEFAPEIPAEQFAPAPSAGIPKTPTLPKQPAPKAPPSLRTAPLASSGDTTSYTLAITNDTGAAGNKLNVVTTDVIPYDARIVGAVFGGVITQAVQWNLALVDQDYAQTQALPPPGLMIHARTFREAGSGQRFTEPAWGVIAEMLNLQTPGTNYASALLGEFVPAGKHLAFCAEQFVANGSCQVTLTITLQRIERAPLTPDEIINVTTPRTPTTPAGGGATTTHHRGPTPSQRVTAHKVATLTAGEPGAQATPSRPQTPVTPKPSYLKQPPCSPCAPDDIHKHWCCSVDLAGPNGPYCRTLLAEKCGGASANLPENISGLGIDFAAPAERTTTGVTTTSATGSIFETQTPV